MKILVTGATGFVGQRVLPLLAGKWEVRCFVRRTSNIQNVEKFGYELVYGDFEDFDSLGQAMSGCNTLINMASLGFGHASGIVKTAEKSRIKRAIFISTTALFTKLNANSKTVRQEAEDCIKTSKLDWTILRPTMIYGALDDRNMIILIRLLDRLRVIPIFGAGNCLQQPVYVEDVAESIVGILLNDRTIQNEYNISGKLPHTYNEIIDLTAGVLGKKIVKVHMPYRSSLFVIKLYEKISKKPLIKVEQVIRLNEDKDFDHSAAKEDFCYNPISFEEGITKEVRLYRQMKNQYVRQAEGNFNA